ncbi:FecR family protein [Spirosoma spitsbergense]|uniref:FecR family protein n=1 Tax=Spirosoma spitsbergense TaxID=431554 RepID=UPI0003719506|nr:FecR family protein [Spirosoma spitsbergense]
MKSYETYEIADFLLDNEFVAWVKHPTRESDSFWQQWQLMHPTRAVVLQEARYWVANLAVNEQLPADQAVRLAVARVQAQLSEDHLPFSNSASRHWLVSAWRIAAAILVVLGIGWYGLSVNRSTSDLAALPEKTNDSLSRENRTERPLSVKLPDGSRVVLAPNSRVLFPAQFGRQVRDVKLTGDAFFEVVRQPLRPFIVHAGDVNVKVLGTSFDVRTSGRNGEVNVVVKTGKVAVSKATGVPSSDQTAVLLIPNQQVTFSAQDNVFRKTLVEAPVLVNQKSQETDFVFEETPIADVFDKLQTAYGIQIDFDREKLKHCTLTARLTNESMYKKLNLVCQAIGGTHETVGTTIVIHAESCNQ